MLRSIGLDFDFDLTEGPGHAIELARSAAREGRELVVSVGGDGTVNEVVNGLYCAGSLPDAALGIVSTGTGADYIRTLGVPRGHKEACQCLLSRRKLQVDLGLVEYASDGQRANRLFVNFAGLGIDAEIVKVTRQRFKSLGATASYLVGLLSTFLSYRNKEVSLELDGRKEEGRVCTVVVSNGRYGGGGMFVAPRADPTDGLLDVLTIGDVSKRDLLWSLPRLYRGTHLTHPKVAASKARDVVVRPGQEMALQADGELLGNGPARFSVLPGALTVVV
jgi:YegS/Rv2252/BmrU family lipid kinase